MHVDCYCSLNNITTTATTIDELAIVSVRYILDTHNNKGPKVPLKKPDPLTKITVNKTMGHYPRRLTFNPKRLLTYVQAISKTASH